MKDKAYRLNLRHFGQIWVVSSPDIRGLVVFGSSPARALALAPAAIEALEKEAMKKKGIAVKGVRLKGSKIEKVHTYRDASAAIRARKSKKQRVVRKTP